MAKKSTAVSSQRKVKVEHHADEFGGPVGCMAVVFGLPTLTMYLLVCLEHNQGDFLVPTSKADLMAIVSKFPVPTMLSVALYSGWFLLQVVLQIFAPGEIVKGMPTANGERLPYNMNGWAALLVTCATVGTLCYYSLLSPTMLVDNIGPLMATANIFAFVFSIALYLAHRVGAFGLRMEQCTGSALYDFFMGGSINPRIGSFDLKCFCEGRPGLMLWMLVNLSAVASQYSTQGHVSTSLLLVTGFHTFYVVDYFWQEDAILTTMDIMHDKFGWMLCWGDLVWVPFTYTLQAQYLLKHPEVDCDALHVAAIMAVNVLGYYIFRSSNGQKNQFRTVPGTKIWGRVPDKVTGYIQTARGTRLLCSGWWGLSRHPNYMGDWLMGLAWCLPCGFAQGHLLPYFYAIYFAVLLIHREQRDAEHCAKKYGKDWENYCEKVPYRIIPYVY